MNNSAIIRVAIPLAIVVAIGGYLIGKGSDGGWLTATAQAQESRQNVSPVKALAPGDRDIYCVVDMHCHGFVRKVLQNDPFLNCLPKATQRRPSYGRQPLTICQSHNPAERGGHFRSVHSVSICSRKICSRRGNPVTLCIPGWTAGVRKLDGISL